MKKLFVIIALLTAVTYLYADNDGATPKGESSAAKTSISGKIFDKITGESLVGVTVNIEGTDKVSYTDLDGNFEIQGVSPGNYNLQVSYISYKESSKAVEIKCNRSNKVKVELESN